MVTKQQLLTLNKEERIELLKLQRKINNLEKKFIKDQSINTWHMLDKLYEKRNDLLND